MIFSKHFLIVQCGGMVAFAALSSRLPNLKEFRNKPPTNVLRFSPARKKSWLVSMMDGTSASRLLDGDRVRECLSPDFFGLGDSSRLPAGGSRRSRHGDV